MIDEGYTKYKVEWTVSDPLDLPQIDELNRWRRPLFDAGLVGHYAELGIGYGNISMRTDNEGEFLITGTQTGYFAELTAKHYSLVTGYDLDDNKVSCRGPVQASSEAMTHAAIYELNSAFAAVVHIHSDELWVRWKGVIPTTDASVAYGTPDMAREFVRLYRDTEFATLGIAVMAGHESGLVSAGASMKEAATRVLELGAGPPTTQEAAS